MPNILNKLVAHRGASATFPENTIIALNEAYKNLKIAEIDIHLTKDQQIIVSHDTDFSISGSYNNKLTTLSQEEFNVILKKPIAELEYQQIQQIDVGYKFAAKFAGTTAPLLREVLNIIPHDCQLFIEIKHVDIKIIENLILEIKQNNNITQEQIIIISFDLNLLLAAKKYNPKIKSIYLTTATSTKDYETLITIDNLQQICVQLKIHGIDGIGFEYHNKFNQTWVDITKKNNLISFVWLYKKDDTLENTRKILATNLDYCNTDHATSIKKDLNI